MSLFWSGFWIGVAGTYILAMLVVLLFIAVVRRGKSSEVAKMAATQRQDKKIDRSE